MAQLSYQQNPNAGRAGLWADSGLRDVVTIINEIGGPAQGIPIGTLVVRTGTRTGRNPSLTPAQVAVDNLILAQASPAAPITLTNPPDFTGALAADAAAGFQVGVLVQLVLDVQANWDDSTATVIGRDANGQETQEVLQIPNNGGVTLVTTTEFVKITGFNMDAQSGTNGTWSLGIAGIGSLPTGIIAGIAQWDPTKEPPATHAIGQVVPCARVGRVWVESETDVEVGDAVYARVNNANGTTTFLGGLRNDRDNGDAALVPGMHFITTGAAGTPVIVQADSR